jgi:hypothetical protein
MGEPMHFLLNDTIFHLNADELSPQTVSRRFAAVNFDFIQTLAREMFAEQPLLHRVQPLQAAKLCALILAKSPTINAALFVAPSTRCNPAQVGVRYASLDMAVMATLQSFHVADKLTPEIADREVWGRLAAA